MAPKPSSGTFHRLSHCIDIGNLPLGKTVAVLPILYLVFPFVHASGCNGLGRPHPIMTHPSLTVLTHFMLITLWLSSPTHAQTTVTTPGGINGLGIVSSIPSVSPAPSSIDISGTSPSFRNILTVPSAADFGANLIPNIRDPQAKDAQLVCPGYIATNVLRNSLGLTATLTIAGATCNVYGNDIDTLNLTVQYQSADRLAIRVVPAVIGASNLSQYILPDNLVHQPTADVYANGTTLASDLDFVWSNDPTFSFSVFRSSTGDTLFSTVGTKLVFEDQFIEFASTLPENYNLYGLGETIHGLRLGNNFTKTIYAADAGDPIDE